MRTRRELKRDIRRLTKAVRDASTGDDGPLFVSLRRARDAALAELADIDNPPPRPELPPGNGSFTMRRARPLTEEEENRLSWRKVVAMRPGSPMQRVFYNPDKGIGVPVDRSKEHVTGLIPRSAMRSGSLPRRFT